MSAAPSGVVIASGVRARVTLSIETVYRIPSLEKVTVSSVVSTTGNGPDFFSVVVCSSVLLPYDRILPL